MPREIKPYMVITSIAIITVLLWFGMGFLLPLLFADDYKDGGVFGDSFGSVNALFSGLAFLGITYTIYLQIESRKDDKRQAEFALYLKLIDEIKNDLDNVELETFKGIRVWSFMKSTFQTKEVFIDKKDVLKPYYTILNNLSVQLDFVIERIEESKILSTNEKEFFEKKISQLYFTYLEGLYKEIIYMHPLDGDRDFNAIKASITLTSIGVSKYLGFEKMIQEFEKKFGKQKKEES